MLTAGGAGADPAWSSVVPDATVTNAKIVSMDGSKLTGTVANFTSTGIDDNATSTAITIDSSETVTFANAVVIPATINAGSIGSSGGTTGKISFGGISGSINGFEITNENGNYLNIKPNSSSNGITVLNGGGLTFNGDTAAANALDDYEEGTWTPSLGGTTTYSAQAGQYTKVGNFVTVWSVMIVSVIGTGSTTVMSGLPFTSAGGAAGIKSGSIYFSASSTAVTSLFGSVYSAETTVDMRSTTAAQASVASNAIFANGTRVDLTLSYSV
jgi:hypothetical protein